MGAVDRGLFHKEIVAPFSGQRFTIRRVRFKEFMTQVGGLPLPMSATVQQAVAALKERAEGGDSDLEDKVTRFYLTRGVVDPKIWFGPEAECPEDQVCWEDLGGDGDFVSQEIIAFSFNLGGLKAMESFFRESGSGAVGLDGQEVRPEAVEPPTPSDV